MALSKEEKKAKKEAKRLEKLQKEAELKKQLRRDELQREIATQARRRDELDKSWREMMLKIKEPLFKKDLEIMWHVFERLNDKKDHLVKHTMNLIDVADDQFQRTIASFCDTIDNMINKFLADLENLSDDNNRRTADLLRLSGDDVNQIKSDHKAAETHLQLLLYVGRTNACNSTWNARGENFVKEDEERDRYFDMREDLRSFLENTYNTMWEEYKSVLRAYVVGTAENQKHVRRLRRKENLMADIIASQAKKIANSDGLLKRLRFELSAYESGSKQQAFRDRRDRHRAAWIKLKKRLIAGCALDDQKLNLLVKSSDETLEWFAAAYKKAETILRLAEMCRKFETRREKVLPFGSGTPLESTEAAKALGRKPSSAGAEDTLIIDAIIGTSGFTRLWHRISKAELTKRALFREKMILEHENFMLMRQIQAYEEGDPIPEELETKACICGAQKKKKDIRCPVAIEGSLELNKYKLF